MSTVVYENGYHTANKVGFAFAQRRQCEIHEAGGRRAIGFRRAGLDSLVFIDAGLDISIDLRAVGVKAFSVAKTKNEF